MKFLFSCSILLFCMVILFSGTALSYEHALKPGLNSAPPSKDQPEIDKMMTFLGVASNGKKGEKAVDLPFNVNLGKEMDVKKRFSANASHGTLIFMDHAYPLKLKSADDFTIKAEIFKIEKRAPGKYTDAEAAAKPSVFKIGTLEFEPAGGDGFNKDTDFINRAFTGELKIKAGSEIDSPSVKFITYLRMLPPAQPQE